MAHKTEFMAADFVILKVVKTWKITSLKKIYFFCLGKILPTQSSNLAIFLGIYADANCKG